MNSYESISLTAVFCYSFLILIFMASKKNAIIREFILFLFSMLLWTLGSVFMRGLALPSYAFWYHVSIAGLLLIPFTFLGFVKAYTNTLENRKHFVYFGVLFILFFVNVKKELFIARPSIVQRGDQVIFQYHFSPFVIVIVLITGIIFANCARILLQYCKENPGAKKSIEPIIQGVVVLAVGHLLLFIPFFEGFPIDILSGIINALFMLRAVAGRHLFELRLLGSKNVYYGIGFVVTALMFYKMFPYILSFCSLFFQEGSRNHYLLYSVIFILIAFFISQMGNVIINSAFIKDEDDYAEKIKLFSNEVSSTLSVDHIMGSIANMIRDIHPNTNIYICLKKEEDYEVCFSNQTLSDLSFALRKDNPIIDIMKRQSFISMKELQYLNARHSVWESEKDQLKRWNITHFIALKNDQDLLGIFMIANENKKKIQYKELMLISSVASIASIAIKNAQLYERVYLEARTDELTGLLNRKYFAEVLEETFEENKGDVITFAIINLDDFKLYNNLYGMAQGDEALRKVASIIRNTVPEQGVVARYSGKEFAIVLPKYDVFKARNIVESICEQIGSMNEKDTNTYRLKMITVSAGISSYPYGAVNLSELVSHADMAVYHVKHKGKNGIQIFDNVLQKDLKSHDEINSKEVYKDYEATVFALMAAIDAKDHYTFSHSHNVAYYATTLAKLMGYDSDVIEMIRQSALLHDIGKISIPEQILNKKGLLTQEEYTEMKNHVEASIEIIRHLPSLDYVIPAVLGHHEHYDGNGYPRRVKGENIPLFARMLCIADSFDAMTSKRCYKDKMSVEKALNILIEEAGKQFDPNLVTVFVKGFQKGEIRLAEDLQPTKMKG